MTPEMIHLFVSRAGAKAKPRRTKPLGDHLADAWPEPRSADDRHEAEFRNEQEMAIGFALIGIEVGQREPYGPNGMGPIPPLTAELLALRVRTTTEGRIRIA